MGTARGHFADVKDQFAETKSLVHTPLHPRNLLRHSPNLPVLLSSHLGSDPTWRSGERMVINWDEELKSVQVLQARQAMGLGVEASSFKVGPPLPTARL